MKHYMRIVLLATFMFPLDLFPQLQPQEMTFPRDAFSLRLAPVFRQESPGETRVLYQSFQSNELPPLADRVVFAGSATQTAWSLEVCFSRDGIDWAEWSAIPVHWYPGGRFWAKAMISREYRAGLLRYRIVDKGSLDTLEIHFYSIECIGPRRAPEDFGVHPSAVPEIPADSIPAPPMVTRSDWGASPPNGVMVPHVPFRAAIHHTAMSRITTLELGKTEMKFIQDLHMNGNGWKDIGYHYCIDDSGRIYQGTEVQYLASHTDNNNTGNVGISLMGNFSSAQPTQKAINSCVALLAYLETRYPIRTDSIFGHLDYVPSTACPGAAAYALLPALRNSVRQMLSDGSPYIKNPLPPPYATAVTPSTSISFQLRDDLEGVRTDSLVVSVNKTAVNPTLQNIDSNEVRVTYVPPVPFDNSTLVTVDIKVQDRAVPPHALMYRYQFRTKAQTIYNELTSESILTNSSWTKTGTWTVSTDDAIMPELSDGVMISAKDSTRDHSIVIHPNIKESGNYIVSLALPRQELGLNARYVVKNSLGIRKEEFIEYNRNYEKTWFQLGTSAVYFTAGSPSNGSIEIQPMPCFTTMMMLDAIKLEKQDLVLPPDVPELKSVRVTSQGNIEIQWYPSLEGGLMGYRVIKSVDGLTWTDTIASEKILKPNDTSFAFSPPSGIGVLYFRIVSVDTQQAENFDGKLEYILSDPSDTYGTSYGTAKKILVVDNFDRIGSWPQKQHSFIRNFGNALGTSWAGWETAVNDAIETGEVRLEDYAIVMYMCGDDSDRDESVSNIELLRLRKYLEKGGYLFISGSEIGYDLGRAGRPDIPLYNSILKSSYLGDDSGLRTCVGIAGSSFEGVTFDFGAVTSDTYIEEFPDYVSPVNGSQSVLYYQNSTKVGGVVYTGLYAPFSLTPGRLVYFALPFETISPALSRTDVMKKVLAYFGVSVGVDIVSSPLTLSHYELQQNFPNPFNPKTTIRYGLPIQSRLTLIVTNTLGQQVAVLENGEREAGYHQVQWNANVASGMYFYRLESVSVSDPNNRFVQVKKMLLLK